MDGSSPHARKRAGPRRRVPQEPRISPFDNQECGPGPIGAWAEQSAQRARGHGQAVAARADAGRDARSGYWMVLVRGLVVAAALVAIGAIMVPVAVMGVGVKLKKLRVTVVKPAGTTPRLK